MKRYCMDCRWYRPPLYAYPGACMRDESRDLVGYHGTAFGMRQAGYPCGPTAELFEPKQPPAPKPLPWWRRIFK